MFVLASSLLLFLSSLALSCSFCFCSFCLSSVCSLSSFPFNSLSSLLFPLSSFTPSFLFLVLLAPASC